MQTCFAQAMVSFPMRGGTMSHLSMRPVPSAALPSAVIGNRLLATLPADTRHFLEPHLALVNLAAGAFLHSPQRPLPHVYFPVSAMLALTHEATPGRQLVVALIDRSGVSGIDALLGVEGGATTTMALLPGTALRLDAGHLRAEFDRSAEVRQRLLGWMQVVLTQVVQAAACNRFHSTEQQVCLRLAQLISDEPPQQLMATQDQLAELLGVRRERVNQALGELQARGVIRQSRGRLSVLDRAGVVRLACNCHGMWLDALLRARLAAE